MIRYEQDAEGMVTLTLDDPRRSVNVVNGAFLQALADAVDRLTAHRASVTGVIVTSGKPAFSAGADLAELAELGPAKVPLMTSRIGLFTELFRRIETLGRPVVAAINGSAVGAGYQLTLACHHRVAVDAPGSLIGMPEASLGLVPDLGGVVRSVRIFGLESALRDVLLPGTLHPPAQALDLGLVDTLIHDPEELIPAARRWARAHPDARQPWDVAGGRDQAPGAHPPADPAALAAFRTSLHTRLGATTPAQRRIVDAAVDCAGLGLEAACAIEARYAVEAVTAPETAATISEYRRRRGDR
jgi:3-hydroxyacyl-CoA dehydrogenase / enoyl-CoA hydratase / 3-hydroxybutyryl-CoA epimerase